MEGPLLEGRAASILGERDDPKITVGALWRRAVDDFNAGDGRIALNGDALKFQAEDLIWSITLVLPELRDSVQPRERFVEGRRLIGRIDGDNSSRFSVPSARQAAS
jgi:hypothetical protein